MRLRLESLNGSELDLAAGAFRSLAERHPSDYLRQLAVRYGAAAPRGGGRASAEARRQRR